MSVLKEKQYVRPRLLLTVLLAACMAFPAAAGVLRTDGRRTAHAAKEMYVCSVGAGPSTAYYSTLDDALNAVPAGGTATIKLLMKIDRAGQLGVGNGKKITLDLDGFKLNIVNNDINDGSGHGLWVSDGAQISLLNLKKGEFNVAGKASGIYVSGIGTTAEVTNAAATGSSGATAAAYVGGTNCEITVPRRLDDSRQQRQLRRSGECGRP